jgi:hypothetical protein
MALQLDTHLRRQKDQLQLIQVSGLDPPVYEKKAEGLGTTNVVLL